MTLGYIHNYIPPRPSEDIIGVSFGEWVVPLKILITVSVAASFVILVSGSFYPCIKVFRWFMLVPAVGIAMGVIVSMFGAVVSNLKPLVSSAVFLLDSLILCSDGRLGTNGWTRANGISRVHSLLQSIDLLFQLVILDPFFLKQSEGLVVCDGTREAVGALSGHNSGWDCS